MAPPKSKRKRNAPYTQDTINQALRDIREKKLSIREVCRNYGVPRATVQDRISGRSTDSIKTRGPDPILTHEIERKIVEWLIDIAKCGFPIKKSELLDTVQKIIKDLGLQTPFKDDRPGQTWFLKFLKRHPEISQRSAEGINKARARVTEESIKLWFRELEAFLVQSNHRDILESPERIFNGDESGFALCPKTGKVLGPRGYRNLYQIKNGSEKDNLTVLVTFNASGQVCPPLIVFPYIRPPKQIADSMPPHWVLGRSESGWMRTDVFFEYITNDFNNWLVSNQIQKPILLLVDGHKSHMSIGLSAMCERLEIILYALPPNTTHILQPADVSVFGPLKSEWKKVVRKFLTKPENINSSVTKTNFCALFKDCLENTNMLRNIINGFRKCGLYPFDPDAVDYTKCVQNTLERLNNSKTPERNSKEITNADLVSTRKVLKNLKLTLAERNINVAVILKEMKKLKRKSSQIQFSDVLYETCSEDLTNSTVNITTSQIVEEDNNMTSQLDDINMTEMVSFENIPQSQADEDLLLQLSNIRPLSPFKTPESLCNIGQDKSVPVSHGVLVTHSDKNSSTEASESLIDNDISTLHLSGSYLDVGSLVSLDDVLIIPTQISLPTTTVLPMSESVKDCRDAIITTQCSTITTNSTLLMPQTPMISNKTSEPLENTLTRRNVLVDIPIKQTSTPNQTSKTKETDIIEKHLYKPQPAKKSDTNNITRTPLSAAISSAEYRKFYEDKEKVKIEKLELRKKRQEILKKKRIEKEQLKNAKVTKRKIAKSKKPMKENERVKVDCALCQDILISDTEEDPERNIGCDFCTKWYHLRCTDFAGLKYEEVQDKPFKCNACIRNQFNYNYN